MSFLFFIFVIIISDYYLIANTSPAIEDTTRSSQLFISNRNIEKIEEMCFSTKLENIYSNDPVCALPKAKKTALCELIFDRYRRHNNVGVYLNKIAFYIMDTDCEETPLTFKTLSASGKTDSEPVVRKMYPCYGTHRPIRTNFMRDDYYRKFYLSTGPLLDSVIVYVHEYDAENDWYSVYEYIEYFPLAQLPERYIQMSDMTDDFVPIEITSTYDQKELEYVYIREREFLQTDLICNMANGKKISLCELVFDRLVYKYFFWLKINKSAFYAFKPLCVVKPVILSHYRPGVKVQVSQKMYPCFGSNRVITYNNILLDKYLKLFYVSGGTRENSLFVYYRRENIDADDDDDEFYLFEFLENVYTSELEFRTIKLEDVTEESPTALSYIDKFNHFIMLKENSDMIEVLKAKKNIMNSMGFMGKGSRERMEELRREEYDEEEIKTYLEKIFDGYSEVVEEMCTAQETEFQLLQSGEWLLTDKLLIEESARMTYVLQMTVGESSSEETETESSPKGKAILEEGEESSVSEVKGKGRKHKKKKSKKGKRK